MSLKEKWKKFKENLAIQAQMSKELLKSRWDEGAEIGKQLKSKHKEVLDKKIRRKK